MTERVIVAMSGGVDSSITAALLKQWGYEVMGITMEIWPSPKIAQGVDRFGGCCSLKAIGDAHRVADHLNIPHYTLNFREAFAQKVINYFCREYARGRTPNPCIKCNQHIKFGILLEKAKEFGADFIATGHYARIEFNSFKGRYILKKGVDSTKDQSYVLYTLTQEKLPHILLPLGNFTKDETRRLAVKLGLPVAGTKESQEICFIPDGDYGKFLKGYMEAAPAGRPAYRTGRRAINPGPILDSQGNILGKHRGILFYTIGQRKGLRISGKEPLYVVSIDGERNALIVGPSRDLYRQELVAEEVNYISVEKLVRPMSVTVKIRYKAEGAPATIIPLEGDKVRVRFKEPQRAITPGQAAVFYDGNIVVGGGTISGYIREGRGK